MLSNFNHRKLAAKNEKEPVQEEKRKGEHAEFVVCSQKFYSCQNSSVEMEKWFISKAVWVMGWKSGWQLKFLRAGLNWPIKKICVTPEKCLTSLDLVFFIYETNGGWLSPGWSFLKRKCDRLCPHALDFLLCDPHNCFGDCLFPISRAYPY